MNEDFKRSNLIEKLIITVGHVIVDGIDQAETVHELQLVDDLLDGYTSLVVRYGREGSSRYLDSSTINMGEANSLKQSELTGTNPDILGEAKHYIQDSRNDLARLETSFFGKNNDENQK